MPSRFVEFFEDSKIMSMARLCTFIAALGLTFAMFFSLGMGAYAIYIKDTFSSAREAFSAAVNFGMMIAGLGGFNYAVNRSAAAYTTVKVSQTEQNIANVKKEDGDV